MKFLDAKIIDKKLTYPGLIAHLRKCHQKQKALAENLSLECVSKNGSQNIFRCRSAWLPDEWLGIQCITDFPENMSLERDNIPRVQAIFVLFDAVSGTPKAIIDGSTLTRWKTSCDSALASCFLSRQNAKSLLMIGAGNLAESLIRGHLSVRPMISEVRIWSRSFDKVNNLIEKLECQQVNFTAVKNLHDAVVHSEIISAATRSITPLIFGEWLAPGMHLDLVGASTPKMREADDEAMKMGDIFVDWRSSTLELTGELAIPIKNKVIKPANIYADLFDLCNNNHLGRVSDESITIFKNGGGGHLDLMTASYIFEKCQE